MSAATEAQGRRGRYEAAINRAWHEGTPDVDAVIAVADAEQAELRAEVERLRRRRTQAWQDAMNWEAQAREAEAALAEERAKVARLRGALREAISSFAHPTHPGRACRQSGHVPVETIARWNAALADPAETPRARGHDDEKIQVTLGDMLRATSETPTETGD